MSSIQPLFGLGFSDFTGVEALAQSCLCRQALGFRQTWCVSCEVFPPAKICPNGLVPAASWPAERWFSDEIGLIASTFEISCWQQIFDELSPHLRPRTDGQSTSHQAIFFVTLKQQAGFGIVVWRTQHANSPGSDVRYSQLVVFVLGEKLRSADAISSERKTPDRRHQSTLLHPHEAW